MIEMVVFVILNYLTVEETIQNVQQIKSMAGEEVRIIIVDNASPNGAGKKLTEKLDRDPLVQVIQNKQNTGFASGNNVGYTAALKYDPDFIVIQNNDIEYTQANFVKSVRKAYFKHHFSVMGPDIFVPETGVHQNPKKLQSYSLKEVEKIVARSASKLKKPGLLKIRVALKQIRPLRGIVLRCRSKQMNLVWQKSSIGSVLHGAFIVFSRDFFSQINPPFDPRTFFYFESEILDLRIKRLGLVAFYNPDITVRHHQNTSTKLAYKNEYAKTVFQLKNMIKSGKILEKYFD